jgi:serine/threonine protein kinase
MPATWLPLSDQLTEGRRFSSEDIIEIGWQVCSALQLAHNLGLAHGGLSAETILLSDNLQVTVVDFGVARWQKAAAVADNSGSSGPALITISALASRQDVEQDLRDLAGLLTELLQTCNDTNDAEPGKVPMRVMLERLLARFEISDPASAAQRPNSAREFQGRLGEILIGTGDDSMPLVDHRNAAATSRRSIVVELFETPESESHSEAAVAKPAGFAWRKQFLPIIAIIAMVVLILWLLADRLL